jgi:hypothetical protein
MKFKATIQLNGKTATGIEVPAAAIDALNAGKRPAVVVKVNAYEYRTAVGVMGGRTLLPFSAEHREKSGLKAGERSRSSSASTRRRARLSFRRI